MGRRLFGSRIGVAVFASVLTAGAVGGVSYAVAAATGGGSSTFFGCSSSTGAMRASSIRVDSPPTCKTGESLRSWNAQGPTGPQGAVGQASVVAIDGSQQCPRPPDPATGAVPGSQWLDIPTIPGEATDPAHLNQIDVLTFSLSASNRSCGGSSVGVGKVAFNEFTITKKTDKASPALMLASMKGTVFPAITLRARKTGGSSDYLTYQFENVLVSSFKFDGGGHGDQIPTESISFNYGKLTVSYSIQHSDGTLDPPVIACFDIALPPSC